MRKILTDNKAGQHLSEFLILFLAVSVAFVGMRVYLKRGVYAKLKHVETQLNVAQTEVVTETASTCLSDCQDSANTFCRGFCLASVPGSCASEVELRCWQDCNAQCMFCSNCNTCDSSPECEYNCCDYECCPDKCQLCTTNPTFDCTFYNDYLYECTYRIEAECRGGNYSSVPTCYSTQYNTCIQDC